MPDTIPERSFAESNRKLLEAFTNYMASRGMAAPTQRAYRDSVGRLIDLLASRNVLETDRSDIRRLQTLLLAKGLHANSIRLHTEALRAFFKFLRVSEMIAGSADPMVRVESRRVPHRLPRVLSIEEIERLIAASETPLERAVIEVLYATAVRVSELVKIRLEDVDFENRVIRVNKGKGGKDRLVLFGRKAQAVLAEYLGERRSGFLFEHGPIHKSVRIRGGCWYACVRLGLIRRYLLLGQARDMSAQEAKEKLDNLEVNMPSVTRRTDPGL